jgi:5-carboxymethyl-2-hydroxymuconate isomerase
VNQELLTHSDIIPIGGLRTRAICLEDYCIADGTGDDAFVHVCLKLGGGRSEEQIKHVADGLFAVVKEHYAVVFKERYLALSMEIHEFTKPTYKLNNIHERYRK